MKYYFDTASTPKGGGSMKSTRWDHFYPERGKGHAKKGGNYWKSNTASRAEQLPTTPIPSRTLE